jgi:hypothetical protein
MSVFNTRARRNVGKEKGDHTAWRTANPLAGDLGVLFIEALERLA